jgi:hypothetical protein
MNEAQADRRVSDAAMAGFVAARFALDHWELFTAWATVRSGWEFGAEDKPRMDADARVLYLMSGGQ